MPPKNGIFDPPGGGGDPGGGHSGAPPPPPGPPPGGAPHSVLRVPPGRGGSGPLLRRGSGTPSRGPRSGPGVAHPLGGAGRGHPTRPPPGRPVVEGPSDAEQRCVRGVVRQVRPLLDGSGKYFGAAKDTESYH